MGEQDRCIGQPSEHLLNGILSNESTLVASVLHAERWSRAEERTEELIACIQPNQPSEERRNAVAEYVQRLIMKCFPSQVFTFGSVPLKTYLPDGDIDLTAFSSNPNLKDTWATLVRDILKSEEQNENAEFHVKEVQYIEAEVKLIKCLVENIVVDISFNQIGGLCTLCFLEEVDHLINQNHLFKRSIILIKAWCYYESRILGAHHGLISTYALETLVLYIFHVFNNSFAGPLEVLYRFLEFFSSFDWNNFCLSLWGPVPISSLPDVTPAPPRKDSGELLLTRGFLEKCNAAYAVLPMGQENQGQPFLAKYFNVIDPLRVNNNLGRSVNKGNFFRIRSAFAFGAKRLARLLSCPREDIIFELNQFFMNTWERHGSGIRPDAPACDIQHPMPSNIDQLQVLSSHMMSVPRSRKNNEKSSAHESVVEVVNSSYNHSIQHSNHPSESTSAQTQKDYANQNSSRVSNRSEKGGSNQGTRVDRVQRNLKINNNVNEYIQGKYLFARTRSSPELTETYTDASSQARRNKAAESSENQVASLKTDNSRRKNGRSDSVSTQSTVSSTDDPSVRNIAPHQKVEIPIDNNSLSSTYVEDSVQGKMSEEQASVVGAQGMLQEEQDLVNMMSSSVNNFGGQFPMPLNFPSTHMPLPFSPSMLASIGYAQRNFAGLMPGNIPMVDPSWTSNLQFAPGLVPSHLPQYFPGLGLNSNSKDSSVQVSENYDSAETAETDAHSEFQHERDGRSSRNQSKYTKENRGSLGDEHQDARMNDVFPDDRDGNNTRFFSASQAKVSKISRDKRGRKPVASATTPTGVSGKGKRISEHASVDPEDDSGDQNGANLGTETPERNSALYLPRHLLSGHEAAQTSSSDSYIPMGPVLLGPSSRQQGTDNSGAPFTFYPTGPPVPFVTMLPFYNVPSNASSSDGSGNLLGREEGLNNASCSQNFESCDGFDDSLAVRVSTTAELPVVQKDILNSDFPSHWQNLQFGRSCQSPRVVYPSPVVVPPGYLQGRSPWDGPGRPVGMNVNLISQMMNYNPHLVPMSSVQPTSDAPVRAYQRYVDDMPRYRAGTGTYLPNPKASRDRLPSGTRRTNYHNDRNDHRGEREGNWNAFKSRPASRGHNRNQADKSSSRFDRLSSNESQTSERPWSSHSHESLPPYQSQNGPLHPTSSQSSSANVTYGMHPGMNPSNVGSNGPMVPSMVMYYPYDNSSGYGGEPLEFGSVGPMGFMGSTEVREGVRARATIEEHRFHGSSQMSSPDQPSSPHLQRRT